MNSILQDKLDNLENASDYECWYLVKQPTSFDVICYLVSFLKEYKESQSSEGLQQFIEKKVIKLNKNNPKLKISNNYRALRVAAFFGLIIMTSSKYEEAIITETFEEIFNRCNGNFEDKESYEDIIQRQIEKMFISSTVDQEFNGVRHNYRLYPVMLLYKILIELGRSTGRYSISMTEYRYFVATTEVFEDFLETLLLIKLLREDSSVSDLFEKYRTKFDNRLIQALKQLPTLKIDQNTIEIRSDKIEEVARKVFIFETNPDIFTKENYLKFLGSNKSLFDIDNSNVLSINKKNDKLENGKNIIFYGIPGCGKSYYIENTVLNGVNKNENVFRTTFYLDYSNSDFIGQIYPIVENDKVKYEPIPGPFTKALKQALKTDDMVYLVIEEINRGNAAAIFGDVFQLLDRLSENKDGRVVGDSEYPISNEFIESYLKKENVPFVEGKIFIPHNLTLLATMNTSDQNVFPLDTAFKRRWDRQKITTNWDDVGDIKNMYVPCTDITWETFAKTVNEKMLQDSERRDISISEDKQMGPYFVKKSMLSTNKNDYDKDKMKSFISNVIDYLYNDVTKFDHKVLFNQNIYSYDKLYDIILDYKFSTKTPLFDTVFNSSVNETLNALKGNDEDESNEGN